MRAHHKANGGRLSASHLTVDDTPSSLSNIDEGRDGAQRIFVTQRPGGSGRPFFKGILEVARGSP